MVTIHVAGSIPIRDLPRTFDSFLRWVPRRRFMDGHCTGLGPSLLYVSSSRSLEQHRRRASFLGGAALLVGSSTSFTGCPQGFKKCSQPCVAFEELAPFSRVCVFCRCSHQREVSLCLSRAARGLAVSCLMLRLKVVPIHVR